MITVHSYDFYIDNRYIYIVCLCFYIDDLLVDG